MYRQETYVELFFEVNRNEQKSEPLSSQKKQVEIQSP